MALSDEQIEALNVRTLGHRHFARAIEAEVRREYEELIRKMARAMDDAITCSRYGGGGGMRDFDDLITAARALICANPPPGPDVPKPEA